MPLRLHELLNQYFLEMVSAPFLSFVNLKPFIPVCNAKAFAKVLGNDEDPNETRVQYIF